MLGPFPVLQFFAGVVILGVCAYAWMRGTKRAPREDATPQITWRFDGPIAMVLKLLEDNAGATKRIEKETYDLAEEARNHTRLLTEIRDRLDRARAH